MSEDTPDSHLHKFLSPLSLGEAFLFVDHLLSLFNRTFLVAPVKKILINQPEFKWKVWSVEGASELFVALGFSCEGSNELIFNSDAEALTKLHEALKKRHESLETEVVYLPRKAILGTKTLDRAFWGFTGSCHYSVGFADTQGGRPTMEDEIVILGMGPNMNPTEDYFAVFDGHGGKEASIFAALNIHKNFATNLKLQPKSDKPNTEKVILALQEAFKEANQTMCGTYDMNCGTCALVTFISENRLYVANLGDSRAVLGLSNGHLRLSEDHKPGTQRETDRIQGIPGGFVSDEVIPRVQGVLSVSRALGDKKTQPFISPEPDIFILDIDPSCCFLVLGCDGVWDKVSDEESVELTKKAKNPFEAATEILNTAISRGSKDNISVVVIFLQDRKDWETDPNLPQPALRKVVSV